MRASGGRRRGFRHFLMWSFWFLVVAVAGSGWYFVERQIPKKLNVVVQEQEEFQFALPFDVTLLSTSEIFPQMRSGCVWTSLSPCMRKIKEATGWI